MKVCKFMRNRETSTNPVVEKRKTNTTTGKNRHGPKITVSDSTKARIFELMDQGVHISDVSFSMSVPVSKIYHMLHKRKAEQNENRDEI